MKIAAFVRLALHPYPASLFFHKLFAKDQPQAGAGFLPGALLGGVCFHVKQIVAGGFIHPGTIVGDGNFHLAGSFQGVYINPATGVGEFYGIGDQIAQDGSQHVFVGMYLHLMAGDIIQVNILYAGREFGKMDGLGNDFPYCSTHKSYQSLRFLSRVYHRKQCQRVGWHRSL